MFSHLPTQMCQVRFCAWPWQGHSILVAPFAHGIISRLWTCVMRAPLCESVYAFDASCLELTHWCTSASSVALLSCVLEKCPTFCAFYNQHNLRSNGGTPVVAWSVALYADRKSCINCFHGLFSESAVSNASFKTWFQCLTRRRLRFCPSPLLLTVFLSH